MYNQYDQFSQHAVIKVVGVGGGGGSAVDRMVENDVSGVEFVAINTDSQALKKSKADVRILLGRKTTEGLGAGADPDVGRRAAEETADEIRDNLSGADMVFITAGMGGGTGSGASPVVAKIAREMKCLTIGVVTKPFSFEGPKRMSVALNAIEELRPYVDALIVIPNDRLLITSGGDDISIFDTFRKADNVLRSAVQGITEIINEEGLINVDFADVRTTLKDKGTALMGIGMASGDNRGIVAANLAIRSPLLETSIDGATSAIVNITASTKVTINEIQSIIHEIQNSSSKTLDIIWGQAINKTFDDQIVVTVIATGFATDPLKNINDKTEYKPEVDSGDDDIISGLTKGKTKKPNKKEKKAKEKKSAEYNSLPEWISKK